MTSEQYAAIPGINWSSLKHLATSPLLYKWRQEHPAPPKTSFIFGGAVHCKLLEPEKFDERYAVYEGKRDARVKEWQAWQAAHPGVESLRPHELERVNACVEAVQAHREAAKILKVGRREEVVTWTDEATGLPCKGRVDWIRPDFVTDLKTTRNPEPMKFGRDAAAYGYASQLAFYHDGAVAARRIPGNFTPFLIAVQSNGPFDVAVFEIDTATLATGRRIYRSLLQKLIDCTESKYWPGVAPSVTRLELPPWVDQGFTDNEEEAF